MQKTKPETDDWGDVGTKKVQPINTKGIDYQSLDLNKLSDFELQQHKAAMDKDYQKNFIKKGDKDFVYDKQVDFSKVAKVDASWDEDEYSDDF